MKILYVNYIPSPYRIDFFNELNQYCDLTVLYYHRQIAERPHWSYQPEKHFYSHDFLFDLEHQWSLGGYHKLVRYLNDSSYDVIVVGGYAQPVEIFAIAWLKFKKRYFVLNTDGGFYQGGKVKLWIKRWLVQSASHCLASGTLAAETLVRYGASKDKVANYHFTSLFASEILPNPVSEAERQQLRMQLDLPQDAFVVLTIGRYIPLKGYELVIEALHQLNRPDLHLVMLGDGILRDTYQGLIVQYELQQQVMLAGEQSKEQVLQYCKAADVMILPTLTSDVWGLVVNEAMSCGLPVIASDRVGAAYDMVVDGETGYRVPAGSSQAIAQAINKIINSPGSMSDKVLVMGKTYAIEQMVEDHLQMFRKIAGNKL